MVSYQLEKELSDIEADIKSSIIEGDNFAYSKNLRRRQETTDKIFFAETKNLRAELENLESDRQAAFVVRDELLEQAQAAVVVVSDASEVLLQAREKFALVQSRQFFNDTQIEQQRTDIQDLKRKLESHINSKLNSGESPTMEN